MMFGLSKKERLAAAQAAAICDKIGEIISPFYIAQVEVGEKYGYTKAKWDTSDISLGPIDERDVVVIAASAFCLAQTIGADTLVAIKALKQHFGYIDDLGGKEAMNLILTDPNLLTRHKNLAQTTYEMWGVLTLDSEADINGLVTRVAESYWGVL
jgi:hypothetical protein